MIAVIDYHKGNIRSVVRGLQDVGANIIVTDAPNDLSRASAIVLPGVGAFKDAMDSLDELGMTHPIKSAIAEGVPFLGICLGMHVLFEGGLEHSSGAPRAGLGALPGTVDAMPKEVVNLDNAKQRFKIPHVGWNSVNAASDTASPLLDGDLDGEYFYFTHSFMSPNSPFTVAETTHSVTFPSIVRKDNAWGVQFHPEKSSGAGARMLANFVSFAQGQA